MRSKLPAHFHAALEIKAPLDGTRLHTTVVSLAEFFNLEFEMEFPRLNVSLLIFRYMTELCLHGKSEDLETLLLTKYT